MLLPEPDPLPAVEQLIIGGSPEIQGLRDRVLRFAATDASVLITGESGTGKELVARALHRHSGRAGRPFVAVNCAAFPETLLEAELFGHERGAFTGAVKKRDGRFKAADHGSLLLDEIAEIPLSSQSKLLRVLQEGVFEPLGTNESLAVDVRVLSATHRDLKDLVSRGRFREDLYYRLKILELHVPPLRDRRGDLALLVAHFLRSYLPPHGAFAVSRRAMAALAAHSFHGNVRELDHAVQHAVALTRGEVAIDLEHLPPDIIANRNPAGEAGLRPYAEAMRDFEREYLRQALLVTRGNRTHAAKLLAISRKSLWERLRRYGLDGTDFRRRGESS